VCVLTDDMRIRQRFGAKVRELRKRNRLSQAALGARAGISGKFVGEVERGGNPTLGVIVAVAEALGVHPRVLFDDSAVPTDSARGTVRLPDLDRARAAVAVLARILRVSVAGRRRR
jgi:transcriptional regulator with XRE-family HTH domain